MDPYHVQFVEQTYTSMSDSNKHRFVKLLQQLCVLDSHESSIDLSQIFQPGNIMNDFTTITAPDVANTFRHPDVFIEIKKLLTKTTCMNKLPSVLHGLGESDEALIKCINGFIIINLIRKKLKKKTTLDIQSYNLSVRLQAYMTPLNIPTTAEEVTSYDYDMLHLNWVVSEQCDKIVLMKLFDTFYYM